MALLQDDSYRAELLSDLQADYTKFFTMAERELEGISKTKPVDQYVRLQKIGQGTFGEVFKVRHKSTKQHFALKRIRMEQEKEGVCSTFNIPILKFPITALREIRILQSLNHENIVCLKEICHSPPNAGNGFKPQFYLVFEFCDHDLAGLSQQIDFTEPVKKAIMKQLLTGVFYLHLNNVLHRDLKAANILIDKNGILKIADFGLARTTVASLRPDRPTRYTGRVVTLWYRPPEILLNDRHYGKPVDMWGAGCIMAELWTKYPIMQGDNEISQLNLIINLCGSITPEIWPGVERLETFREARLPQDIKRHVREKLTPKISSLAAVDLIDQLLVLDPSKRLDAEQALSHDYFYEDPPVGDLRSFSKSGTSYLEFLSSNNARGRMLQGANRPGIVRGPVVGPGQQMNYLNGPGIMHPNRRPPIPDDNSYYERVF
ncbi:cyclin-dependent kinase 9 [Schistosoma bovis]|uniref:Cyclin-dependent kinase 9 n=1 Tax=Schistosoma bovis TaxID=6184 RepID=A0A430QKU2_SCHBO|nr:cyclin-dependent kinase 9 [Schistosoma bovis]